MGLRQAIDHLPGGRETETAVREVLELFRIHSGQPLSFAQVAHRLERPEPLVGVVLSALTECFVLRRDGSRYVYMRDSSIDLEIDRFMRRAESNNAFVQSNVAKFRERYGSR
jgi:hypothetical protein